MNSLYKLQALVYDILPSRRKVPESGVRSVLSIVTLPFTVSGTPKRHDIAYPS